VEASVTVPPGIDEFQVIAVDQAGNRSRKRKALIVPPFPKVAFGPAPETIGADGKSPLVVSVAAVSPAGELLSFDGKCRATEGRLKSLKSQDQTGRWQLLVTKVGSGQTRITCNLGGGKGKAILQIGLVPGTMHTLHILGPSECSAGEACDLEVQASDIAGNPIVDLPLFEVAAEPGSLVARESAEGAPRLYIYQSPQSLSAGRVAKLQLVDPSTGLEASTSITLTPAKVAELAFDVVGEPSVLVGSELEIPVRAVDSFGNRVAVDPAPSLSAKVGEVTWMPGADESSAAVLYRVAAGTTAESDLIHLSYQEMNTELPLHLEGRWRRTSISGRAGVLVLRNGIVAPTIAVDFASALPIFDARLAATLRIAGAWSLNTFPIKLKDGRKIGKGDQTLWYLPFLAGLETRIFTAPFTLDTGVGGGGLVLWTDIDTYQGEKDELPPDRSSTVLSAAVGGHLRAAYDLGPGSIELGGDVLWAWTRPASSIRGDLLAFGITLGWRSSWSNALW
ncbi:hypothetical protein ACFL6C_13125, partial [Myxococcota bacterium]